jgi:L-lactate dehydrogenase (cytochrome)
VFDYADRGTGAEITLTRARRAFEDIEFQPRVLRGAGDIDTTRTVLGMRASLPFGIAPAGFGRMMHTEGEHAGAQAAARAGIPFTLATMGTASIQDVARANPHDRNWFQLYLWRDRGRSLALMQEAAAAGFDTLLVTVDVPVAGARLRDRRTGMSVPPTLGWRSIPDIMRHPQWWFDYVTGDPLAFTSFNDVPGALNRVLDTMFDPTLTFDDLQWLRHRWPGKLVAKGVQTVSDSIAVAELGIDGILLSSHGGRQLDRAPVGLHLLPAVVEQVGSEVEVLFDSGITSGADIVAAIALGARFTLVGRAYLYGLMAGGGYGADRAIEILADQVRHTMRHLGAASLDELSPEHITLRTP